MAGATSARRLRHRRRHTIAREWFGVRELDVDRARRRRTSEAREVTSWPDAVGRVSLCTARDMSDTHLMYPSDELVVARMRTGVDDVAWWTYETSCGAISDRDNSNSIAY